MNISLKIKYSTQEHSWLCFACAVSFAQAGHIVETTVDDYDSEYYMGSTYCEHPDVTPLEEVEEK